ncbi:MAG: GNAT family N-acetyltransferase, partial [Alphaproteobacteria bacterium]
MNTDVYPSFEALPDRYRGLLAKAAADDFFLSAPWFANQVQTTGGPGDALRIYAAETESGPAAILVLRALAAREGAFRLRTLSSCSSIYSTFFGPILAPSDAAGAGLRAIAKRIGHERPRFDAVRIDSLDRDAAAFARLVQGFREAGMLVQPFFHFGNWYEDIERPSLDGYLKRRSSQQRYQIRHRSRKLMQSGRARFELVTGGPALEAGIADYERVYASSWKVPEPYPLFTAGLVRVAAAAGVLRMGFLRVDGEPAAAQIWIVSGGHATIFKLVFVEKF